MYRNGSPAAPHIRDDYHLLLPLPARSPSRTSENVHELGRIQKQTIRQFMALAPFSYFCNLLKVMPTAVAYRSLAYAHHRPAQAEPFTHMWINILFRP